MNDTPGKPSPVTGATLDEKIANARKQLDATLNGRLAEAEQAISARRTAAMANVKDIAVETAATIVERLTGNAPAGADVAKAVSDTLKR